MKAAIYVRASTSKQAQAELSIPDQIAQCRAYCASHGWEEPVVFVDRGYSATTDNRPEFQAMLAEAKAAHHAFDVIVVHSLSRFARSLPDLLCHKRDLQRAKVSLVSITQDFGDGDQADMMAAMVGLLDEHQSRETSKHVSRSMIENARQGFWNGAQPPFGYRTYVAEVRGKKEKKKLAIAQDEADIVRLIFDLYLHGDGHSGPMGTKRIASHLNTKGYRTRTGKPFRVQFIHKILTNEAYLGEYFFNRTNSKTGEPRPQEEWVTLEIPRLIDTHIFNAVQDKLDRQHPMKTPPRIVTSNVLLTGLAHCGECGKPLRLQTGKGGKYRYYKCAKKADHGQTGCKGCSIPEALLDDAVTDALLERALAPERLATILPPLIDKTRQQRGQNVAALNELKSKKADYARQRRKFYDLLGEGTLEPDPELTKKLADLKSRQEQTERQIARLENEQSVPLAPLSRASLSRFAEAARRRLKDAQNPAFRKAYLRALVGNVTVQDRQVTMTGSEAVLAAAATSQYPEKVPCFAQEWRTGPESLQTRS
ncbi:recombinase family protein [Parvularcula marina]|uniref:recombinase family protein n=1 Tax=Parvularcula marina TaxID=2292771 RepID=UPI0035129D42